MGCVRLRLGVPACVLPVMHRSPLGLAAARPVYSLVDTQAVVAVVVEILAIRCVLRSIHLPYSESLYPSAASPALPSCTRTTAIPALLQLLYWVDKITLVTVPPNCQVGV